MIPESTREDHLQELLVWMQDQASRRIKRCPPDFTLQTVDLVNEAVLKIMRNNTLQSPINKAYLFGAAAQAIREALADAVRRRLSLRNGGSFDRVKLSDLCGEADGHSADLLDLHEAVEALRALDERAALVVDLKFYAALTITDIAEMLDVSNWTVENDWRKAKSLLKKFLTN